MQKFKYSPVLILANKVLKETTSKNLRKILQKKLKKGYLVDEYVKSDFSFKQKFRIILELMIIINHDPNFKGYITENPNDEDNNKCLHGGDKIKYPITLKLKMNRKKL